MPLLLLQLGVHIQALSNSSVKHPVARVYVCLGLYICLATKTVRQPLRHWVLQRQWTVIQRASAKLADRS